MFYHHLHAKQSKRNKKQLWKLHTTYPLKVEHADQLGETHEKWRGWILAIAHLVHTGWRHKLTTQGYQSTAPQFLMMRQIMVSESLSQPRCHHLTTGFHRDSQSKPLIQNCMAPHQTQPQLRLGQLPQQELYDMADTCTASLWTKFKDQSVIRWQAAHALNWSQLLRISITFQHCILDTQDTDVGVARSVIDARVAYCQAQVLPLVVVGLARVEGVWGHGCTVAILPERQDWRYADDATNRNGLQQWLLLTPVWLFQDEVLD